MRRKSSKFFQMRRIEKSLKTTAVDDQFGSTNKKGNDVDLQVAVLRLQLQLIRV